MECRVPLAFFFYLRKRRHRKYTTVNRSWPKRQPAEILLLSFVQFYTMTAEDLYTVYKGVLMPTLIHPPESLMRFERFTFRPDDVLIVTYPKSGKVRLPPHASKVFVKNKIILLKYALNNSSMSECRQWRKLVKNCGSMGANDVYTGAPQKAALLPMSNRRKSHSPYQTFSVYDARYFSRLRTTRNERMIRRHTAEKKTKRAMLSSGCYLSLFNLHVLYALNTVLNLLMSECEFLTGRDTL